MDGFYKSKNETGKKNHHFRCMKHSGLMSEAHTGFEQPLPQGNLNTLWIEISRRK